MGEPFPHEPEDTEKDRRADEGEIRGPALESGEVDNLGEKEQRQQPTAPPAQFLPKDPSSQLDASIAGLAD